MRKVEEVKVVVTDLFEEEAEVGLEQRQLRGKSNSHIYSQKFFR